MFVQLGMNLNSVMFEKEIIYKITLISNLIIALASCLLISPLLSVSYMSKSIFAFCSGVPEKKSYSMKT